MQNRKTIDIQYKFEILAKKKFLGNIPRNNIMVEPRGIEPLSEGNLTRLSPGAVCYLHSLCPAGTNTLRTSVAS